MKVCLLVFGLVGILSACRKDAQQHEQDVAACRAYVKAQNIPALQDPNADYFYYFRTENERPKLVVANEGLTLKVRYQTTLLDGTVVADTGPNAELVQLDESIYGWRLALPRMGLGERMLLVLPSRLAYSNESNLTIPSYSNLVFDIELLDVYPQF